MTMTHVAWVIFAGAVGVGLRLWLSLNLVTVWPWALWIANTLGCFGIGLVYAAPPTLLSTPLKVILAVGLMGGLTTFSSYILISLEMFEKGQWGLALLNLVGSNLLGLTAVLAGLFLMKSWAS